MGRVNTIIKLLGSPNTDDYKIGKILLGKENYYPYLLEYMAEVLTNRSMESPIRCSNVPGSKAYLHYFFEVIYEYKTIVKYEMWEAE